MKIFNEEWKLHHVDSEDVYHVIGKLQKSFGIVFKDDAFKHVQTFGELCNVFTANVNNVDSYDCTPQQAFYRVRKAIALSQATDDKELTLNAQLVDIFPLPNRRKKVKTFIKFLAVDIKILTFPTWLGWLFFVGILASLIMFFFDWKFAIAGLVLSISTMNIADRFGEKLTLVTVRELVDMLYRENYAQVRRTKGTVNKNEILKVMIKTFAHDLDIEEQYLTPEARFNEGK